MKRPARIAPHWWTALAVAILLHPLETSAAAPSVSRVQPVAVIPGTTTTITLHGENLNGAVDLWTSFPAEVSRSADGDHAMFQLRLPSQTPTGIGAVRLITTNGMSGLLLLLVDSLTASPGGETNHSLTTAQPITIPGAVDGSCASLRSDFFRITARKGCSFSA